MLLLLGLTRLTGFKFFLDRCGPRKLTRFPRKRMSNWNLLFRAVIKRRGPGISPSYYERLPRLLSKENERKIEPKEIPSCLIPRLVVVFTRQLEILVTTLIITLLILKKKNYLDSVFIWLSGTVRPGLIDNSDED